MSQPQVEIDGVTVSVGRRRLLAPVSRVVQPGSCLVVRGENGSGKTTLLRVVTGLLAPSGGSVRLDGEVADERRAATRRQVSALLGASAAYPDLTVYEHLLLIDASWGGDAATLEARVDAALGPLGLTELADRFPHELSSGQRHLVDLALTLFRPAGLLVLDEPEQRLDADRRALVAGILRRRVEEGATMIVATHDGLLAETVADDEVVLLAADRGADDAG